jgi:hypothetical protein
MLAAPPLSLLDTLNAVDDAIDENADLADEIFRLGLASFGLSERPPKESPLNWLGKARPNDISKAHSTIRQFYRDWSREGFAREIQPLLDTILSDLSSCLARPDGNREPPSLLLPGAGLGRILFELCSRGYNATGNEISYHQLLASNFILNCTERADQYSIYPFANTFTNITSRKDQLACHTVPDVHPGQALSARLESDQCIGEMNMTAGDFVLSYSAVESQETFDGVVSVFFIDTAPNLIRYIETVRNCLKKGGVWVNIGPLLWHFDDRLPGGANNDDDVDDDEGDELDHGEESRIGDFQTRSAAARRADIEDKGIGEPGSFELSDEEVVHLVSQLGFDIVRHELLGGDDGQRSAYGFGVGYMQDPSSLLQNRYRCSHWVARKR